MDSESSLELPYWPESDYAELFRRMEAQIPKEDNEKFDSRAAKLNWGKIAFGDYSIEECLEAWSAISKRMRQFRTLNDIIEDAKEWVTNFYREFIKNLHPGMPGIPLHAYMIYYEEQKDEVVKNNPGKEMTQIFQIISEMYKKLSHTERDKYIELVRGKTHTEVPTVKESEKPSNLFKLFFQEQLKMYGGDSAINRKRKSREIKEKWKNLSNNEKLVWIERALEDYNRYEYEKNKRIIKERKKNVAGKLVKPPTSAYSLFSTIMLQSDPDIKTIPPKDRMAEISKKWKVISDAQKSYYEEEVRAMQENYKEKEAGQSRQPRPRRKAQKIARRKIKNMIPIKININN